MLNIENLIKDVSPLQVEVNVIEIDNVYYISMAMKPAGAKLAWDRYWGGYTRFCRYFISKYFQYKSLKEENNGVIFEIGSVFDVLNTPEILKENYVDNIQ